MIQDGSQQLGVRAHSHRGNGSERGCDNLLYCLDWIAVRGEMRDADPVAWAGPRVPCMLPGASELDIRDGTTWHIYILAHLGFVKQFDARKRAGGFKLTPSCSHHHGDLQLSNQKPTSPKHKAPQARK